MGDRTTVTTLWQVLMKGDEIVDKKLRRLTKSIEDTENGMTRTTTMTDKLNESTGKLDRTISTKTVPAVKTFQFEFLGLMFAGMALQQTMFGLFNPAMQTAGVFELFGTILELFFLPVALLLLYPLTALLGLVNEFPDGLKLFLESWFCLREPLEHFSSRFLKSSWLLLHSSLRVDSQESSEAS